MIYLLIIIVFSCLLVLTKSNTASSDLPNEIRNELDASESIVTTAASHLSDKEREKKINLTSLFDQRKNMGAALCSHFQKIKIMTGNHRDCSVPSCLWDDWNHIKGHGSLATSEEKVILSYGHNGMGNQLWQHTFAFMVAESFGARLLITPITSDLAPNGFTPPNTWEGVHAIRHILPDEFNYEKLPSNHSIRKMCEEEKFVISDRKIDHNSVQYKDTVKKKFLDIWWSKEPRCLKSVGYFQSYFHGICRDDVRQLWTGRLHNEFPLHPAKDEVGIYLRCELKHYHFNGKEYFKTILDRMTFTKVWLFLAPACMGSVKWVHNISDVRFWRFHVVINFLQTNYNATMWPTYWLNTDRGYVTKDNGNGTVSVEKINILDSKLSVLSDLSALTQCDKLIIPHSSWGFWGGFLSNASEIHVNHVLHPYITGEGEKTYFYHSESKMRYFGQNDQNGKFKYAVNLYEIKKREELEEKEKQLLLNATKLSIS